MLDVEDYPLIRGVYFGPPDMMHHAPRADEWPWARDERARERGWFIEALKPTCSEEGAGQAHRAPLDGALPRTTCDLREKDHAVYLSVVYLTTAAASR